MSWLSQAQIYLFGCDPTPHPNPHRHPELYPGRYRHSTRYRWHQNDKFRRQEEALPLLTTHFGAYCPTKKDPALRTLGEAKAEARASNQTASGASRASNGIIIDTEPLPAAFHKIIAHNHALATKHYENLAAWYILHTYFTYALEPLLDKIDNILRQDEFQTPATCYEPNGTPLTKDLKLLIEQVETKVRTHREALEMFDATITGSSVRADTSTGTGAAVDKAINTVTTGIRARETEEEVARHMQEWKDEQTHKRHLKLKEELREHARTLTRHDT